MAALWHVLVSFDPSIQPHSFEKELVVIINQVSKSWFRAAVKNMLPFGGIQELKGDIYTKCSKSKVEPNRVRKKGII